MSAALKKEMLMTELWCLINFASGYTDSLCLDSASKVTFMAPTRDSGFVSLPVTRRAGGARGCDVLGSILLFF